MVFQKPHSQTVLNLILVTEVLVFARLCSLLMRCDFLFLLWSFWSWSVIFCTRVTFLSPDCKFKREKWENHFIFFHQLTTELLTFGKKAWRSKPFLWILKHIQKYLHQFPSLCIIQKSFLILKITSSFLLFFKVCTSPAEFAKKYLDLQGDIFSLSRNWDKNACVHLDQILCVHWISESWKLWFLWGSLWLSL